MGVSIYPVLNKDVPGFDVTEMSGKALATVVFELSSAFAVLERFSSMSEDELRELTAGETGQNPSEIEVPTEEWFSPKDGLTVVRTLLVEPAPVVERAAGDFAEWLVNDLRALEKMLVLAQEHGALFHLAMDF